MEKTISAEERIRRAEEIYARRKNANQGTSIPYARVNVGEKRKNNLIRKMIIQIFICVVIYTGFYIVKNGNYIFSGQLIDQIKSILEYDISLENVSNDVINYINQIKNTNADIPEENKQENTANSVAPQEALTEGITDETQSNTIQSSTQTETLGVTDEVVMPEETSSVSQEEIDANYIKENYSLIKPLTGTITSRFGNRNPTVETVSKYHTGIDIAANTGTKIIAAMDGEVTLVSSTGAYRKSLRNNKRRSYNTICTLQQNICKRGRQSYTRTRNCRSWSNRKCYRTSFAF